MKVAVRNVFLIQTVLGDAEGGVGTYWLGWPPPEGPEKDPRCVAGLPGDLRRQIGITSATLVDLRTGAFNINAAINGRRPRLRASPRMPWTRRACSATQQPAVSGLPDHCEAENPTNVGGQQPGHRGRW